MTQAAVDSLIQQYLAAWNEYDSDARQRLLDQVWHAEGTYTDPLSHAVGRDALNALIARFHAENPSARFVLRDAVSFHHDFVRLYWCIHLADGAEFPGMDYGEIAPDGKLAKIVGFF